MIARVENRSLLSKSTLNHENSTMFLRKLWTSFDVLFPLISRVFFEPSKILGSLFLIRLTLFMDFGSFFIVDIIKC